MICLALGTGVNTAGLSVINAILLKPLPFPNPERLVIVQLHDTRPPKDRVFSLTEYRQIAPLATAFSELSARTFFPVSVSAGGSARMAQAEVVSRNYFAMLQVNPMFGRLPEGPAEAVVSERLWRERFSSDPEIVGRLVRVNGRDLTITAVAPAGFVGATQLIAADLWLPMSFAADNTTPQFGVMGRLRPGATRAQARVQIDALLAGLTHGRPGVSQTVSRVEAATGFGFPVIGRPAAALLFLLMALLMAVAVANVAGLMLARSPGRRREIGVRLALGASSSRIVSLILTESVLLSVAGSAIGAALATALMLAAPGLGVQLPEHLRYALDARVDFRVLLYAAITAVSASILFALAPTRQALRTSFVDVLRLSGTSRMTPGTTRTLNALVVGQLAISTALLAGAFLLAQRYVSAQSADPGIDTGHALAATLDLDQGTYDASSGLRFYRRLMERVTALPGVEAAAMASEVPLAPGGNSLAVVVDSLSGQGKAEGHLITPGYFSVLRIPLLQGRGFAPSERGVAVVNQTMASKFWPGRPAVGQTFRVGADQLQVIGVAMDIKNRSLLETRHAVFYRPVDQYSPRMALLVRSRDAATLANVIRQSVQAEDPRLSLLDVRTMQAVLEAAIAPRRQAAMILLVVCALGLFLSATGLYGVVAYGVRERSREFGLRMALGARPADVTRLVVWRALRLASLGFSIGLLASFGLARILASIISGVGSPNLATAGLVCGVLALVAIVASYRPARWASRIEPAITLRCE